MPVATRISLYLLVLTPLFWTIVFWFHRKKSTTNLYMFLLMVSIFALTLTNAFSTFGNLIASMVLRSIYPFAANSIPILYILFMYHFVSIDQKLPRVYYLFFLIPGFQTLLSGYAFYIHIPDETLKTYFYDIIFHRVDKLPSGLLFTYHVNRLTSFIFLVSFLGMSISSAYFIPLMFKNIGQEFSDKRERLAMRILLIINVIVIISVGSIYVFNAGKRDYNQWNSPELNLFLSLSWFFCFYLIYKELKLKNTLIRLPAYTSNKNSSLSKQLELYFTVEKPYLVYNLKISDVAVALGTNRTYISQMLNFEKGTNFNSYVNRYRIAEAKRLLKESADELKAQDVALKSGFNSYATFFRAFKEITGMAFKDYMAKHTY